MQIEELMQKAKDSVDIHQVYGEPYERNGVTIIPVARVSGGGGSGKGSEGAAVGGSGVGYGFKAEPAGVYVINGDSVSWQPAVNVNKIIAGSFVVAVVALWKAPRIIKTANKLFR